MNLRKKRAVWLRAICIALVMLCGLAVLNACGKRPEDEQDPSDSSDQPSDETIPGGENMEELYLIKDGKTQYALCMQDLFL